MHLLSPALPGRRALARPSRAALIPDRRDLLLAVGLLGLALVIAIVSVVYGHSLRRLVPDALSALLVLPLAWRRRWPMPVFCVVAIGALVHTDTAGVLVAAFLIATYSLGAYGARVPTLIAIPVTVPLLAVAQRPPPIGFLVVLLVYVLLGTIWFVGQTIQRRERRTGALVETVARLEREQEQTTQAALAAERRRIARELHDVVTHNVSVMVVQAGAARHVMDAAPEQAREALLAVEATGREALTELRHLLGLLSHDGDDAALAPQPGVAQLPTLVRRTQDASLPVSLAIIREPRVLPQGIDLAVYRIVQEALTNAMKHAGQARTAVLLTYQPGGLAVEITDTGSGALSAEVSGRGLVGMRERAALYGGTLEAGPCPEGGYAVRAWFPLAGAR